MLSTRLKSSITGIGLKLIVNETKQCKKSANILCHKLGTWQPCKQMFINPFSSTVKFSSFRFNSTQATVPPKNESDFQELLRIRKQQADRSVIVEVKTNEEFPYAVAHCEKFGSIKNAYSYSGEKEKFYLLLEFANETDAEALLEKCGCKKAPDIIPVHSRLLQYEKKIGSSLTEVRINEERIPKSSLKPGASISEIIQDIYSTERLTELDIRLRYFFCTLIKKSVSGLFPHCEVTPFGSSVNGIGKQGCDLDVTLRLDSKQVNGDSELHFVNRTYFGKHKYYQQKMVFCLGEVFRTFLPGISSVDKVMFARVPIVEMHHKILKLDCDLSFDNLSPLHMSDVIYFCGEIDDRVRPLVYSVKKWAKEARITSSSPGSWITNFGLTNLVIFFLQNRPNPILPPLKDALEIIGEEDSFDFGIKYLKSIDEWKSCASINKESLAVLLKEFLLFLATEPFEECIISLMSGKGRMRQFEDRLPLWMQYPFDEGSNITKNVSSSEFKAMQAKAKISAECLESYLKHKDNPVTDFCALLDISSVSSIGITSREADVTSSIGDDKTSKKVKHRTF